MKNSKYIILCILSVFCMKSEMLVAQGVNHWDGSDTTAWINGIGSIGMPYLIESAGNLACLAKRVNEGTKYEGVYFKLTTNLNLAAGNWTPIGISTSKYFGGYFDGDYYTIDSLTISSIATATSFVGLFGIVQNSIIQKVVLSNINVSQTSVSSNMYTGGLLGATLNGDYISNCSVLSGRIYSVSSSGNKGYAGGIVGISQLGTKNTKIMNCSNSANVYANCAVGGIAGMINANSTDADTVWLNSCNNTGLINGLSTIGNIYCGGVIGWLNLSKNNTICYIDNCYNTAHVKDSTHGGVYIYTGGLIGYLQNLAAGNTGIAAYISNSWNSGRVENINTLLDLTTQKWSYVAGITGNTTLYGIASLYYTNVYNSGDIYFFRRSPQTVSAVGGILGLISAQQAGGLISLRQTYNIGNITLASPDTSNNVTFTGGIIGWLYNNEGNYEIDKCLNTGNITNDSYYSGGIVGYLNGFNTSGNVLSNCFNSGTIKSKNTAGGITAYYANKSLANTITNCINVGVVCAIEGGASGIAGVLGDSTTLNLSSCYFDRQITNVIQAALPLGLNSTCIFDTLRYARQLTQIQLDTNWHMEANMYPRLRSMKDMDEMILGATPIFFYANESLNSYNTVSKVNKSFGIGGKIGTFVHSSNTGILSIINNDSAIVTALGTDTMTITLSYGNASRKLDVIVLKETLIKTEVCQYEVYNLFGRGINTDTAGIFTYYGVDTVAYVTVNPIYNHTDTITICDNVLPYSYGDSTFTMTGNYDVYFTSVNGCDSLVTLQLYVNPAYDHTDTITICDNGLPYNYGDSTFTITGNYDVYFTSVNGCDSLVALQLYVNPTYAHTDTITICDYELPYSYGDSTFTMTGNYDVYFTSVNGCDSTVSLRLNVFNCQGTDIVDICSTDLPYTYGDSVFTSGGVYQVVFKGYSGNDSTIALTLRVHSTYNQYDTLRVCNNEFPFTYSDSTILISGDYLFKFNSIWGCDSNIYLTVYAISAYDIYDTISICNNELPYTYGDSVFAQEGDYVVYFHTTLGCDSIINLRLNVVNRAPVAPLQVYGDTAITTTGVYTYYVDPVTTADSYVWTISNTDWTASSTTETVDVTIPNAGSGIISVKAVNICGESDATSLQILSSVNITEMEETKCVLGQNIPNPAFVNMKIPYTIPQDGRIVFNVMSINGQMLYREEIQASSGTHYLELNTQTLSNGIYYYSMEYKGQCLVKKMIVQK